MVFSIPTAHAAVQELEVDVHGMACSFCAYGLEKKVKQLPGVESIEVDIKKGKMHVKTKEGAEVSLATLNAVVKDAGLTMRDVAVSAVGKVHQTDLGFSFSC